MNLRKLTLLALAILLLTSCQLAKTQPTEQPKGPGDGAYPAPTQPGANTYPSPIQSTLSSPANLYPAFKDGDQVTWNQAIGMINNGEVKKIIAAQTLQITLFLKDGRTLLTQQPAQGELQKIIQACGEVCKDIEVVNE